MKLGDVVYSTKTKPYSKAVIAQVDMSKRLRDDGKKETRIKYVAKYSDGSCLHFGGNQVNKSVFLSLVDGQMELKDFMDI